MPETDGPVELLFVTNQQKNAACTSADLEVATKFAFLLISTYIDV